MKFIFGMVCGAVGVYFALVYPNQSKKAIGDAADMASNAVVSGSKAISEALAADAGVKKQK